MYTHTRAHSFELTHSRLCAPHIAQRFHVAHVSTQFTNTRTGSALVRCSSTRRRLLSGPGDCRATAYATQLKTSNEGSRREKTVLPPCSPRTQFYSEFRFKLWATNTLSEPPNQHQQFTRMWDCVRVCVSRRAVADALCARAINARADQQRIFKGCKIQLNQKSSLQRTRKRQSATHVT